MAGVSQSITLQYYIRPHQYITTLQRVVFKDNCNITDFEGKWKVIMGGGSFGTPNLYYVINGQPLTSGVETLAVFVLKDNVRSQFLS